MTAAGISVAPTALRSIVLLLCLVAAAVLLLASRARAQDGAAVPGEPPGCRQGKPLANVRSPERLKVVRPCIAARGTVASVTRMGDGDFHVNLRLIADQNDLLNVHNIADQDGQLVTEIVPADQPGCTPGKPPSPQLGWVDWIKRLFAGPKYFGICTGANISPPSIGAHVIVVGPYVLDKNHGWMEIHPVWLIEPDPAYK